MRLQLVSSETLVSITHHFKCRVGVKVMFVMKIPPLLWWNWVCWHERNYIPHPFSQLQSSCCTTCSLESPGNNLPTRDFSCVAYLGWWWKLQSSPMYLRTNVYNVPAFCKTIEWGFVQLSSQELIFLSIFSQTPDKISISLSPSSDVKWGKVCESIFF